MGKYLANCKIAFIFDVNKIFIFFFFFINITLVRKQHKLFCNSRYSNFCTTIPYFT